MGFRFQKRIQLFPGLRLNLSNGSPSLSIGPRGASLTVGKRGVYANAGIPGSGLSYRTRLDRPNGRRRTAEEERAPRPPERLPPMQFNLRIRGAVPEYLDDNEQPLPAEDVELIKQYYRDQLLEQFDRRVVDLDNARAALGHLHHAIQPPAPRQPRPTTSRAQQVTEYPVPKPVKPSDPAEMPAYMELLSAWRVKKAEFEARAPMQAGPPEPDLQAIAQPILARLGGIEWPRETTIDLDLSEDGRTLILHVDLPELEDMPAVTYAVLRSSVEIVERAASAKNIAELYAAHVHAIAMRLIGEAFTASGVIDCVQFDGYTQRVSAATGRMADEYVLSVRAARDQWSRIHFGNLAAIDPVTAVEQFEHRRILQARGRLKTIQPFK